MKRDPFEKKSPFFCSLWKQRSFDHYQKLIRSEVDDCTWNAIWINKIDLIVFTKTLTKTQVWNILQRSDMDSWSESCNPTFKFITFDMLSYDTPDPRKECTIFAHTEWRSKDLWTLSKMWNSSEDLRSITLLMFFTKYFPKFIMCLSRVYDTH